MRLGLSLLVILMLQACGNPTPVVFYSQSEAPQPNSQTIRLPTMKFNTATEIPMGDCEIGIRADLQARGNRFTGVILRDFTGGSCEFLTPANPRFYEFQVISTQCGSVTYSGTLETSDSISHVVFTDHSDRKCQDSRPATFELEETAHQGITRKFYGDW